MLLVAALHAICAAALAVRYHNAHCRTVLTVPLGMLRKLSMLSMLLHSSDDGSYDDYAEKHRCWLVMLVVVQFLNIEPLIVAWIAICI